MASVPIECVSTTKKGKIKTNAKHVSPAMVMMSSTVRSTLSEGQAKRALSIMVDFDFSINIINNLVIFHLFSIKCKA